MKHPHLFCDEFVEHTYTRVRLPAGRLKLDQSVHDGIGAGKKNYRDIGVGGLDRKNGTSATAYRENGYLAT
jgi:hypothetical protein